jgi:hypothetical protein
MGFKFLERDESGLHAKGNDGIYRQIKVKDWRKYMMN